MSRWKGQAHNAKSRKSELESGLGNECEPIYNINRRGETHQEVWRNYCMALREKESRFNSGLQPNAAYQSCSPANLHGLWTTELKAAHQAQTAAPQGLNKASALVVCLGMLKQGWQAGGGRSRIQQIKMLQLMGHNRKHWRPVMELAKDKGPILASESKAEKDPFPKTWGATDSQCKKIWTRWPNALT